MKIGSIDILKAYLGALELTNSNAFIGTIPVIENGPEPVSYPGLKFTSKGSSTVSMKKGVSGSGSTTNAPKVELKYSLDNGKTWTQWDFSSISLKDGQTVCFKGKNTNFGSYFAGAFHKNYFVMTGSIAASGNIMSIIDDGACTTKIIPADYCFYGLFDGCTSLTTAPELPATTLKVRCYWTMFTNCTSLTTAPELPATTLQNYCYAYMFSKCTKINYIKCLATNISASGCTEGWVNKVASTGTFVKAASMTGWTTGTSGIPSGWTVQNAA